MARCLRIQCKYYDRGCSVGLDPEHPECPLRNEKQTKFTCTECDFCGQPVTDRIELHFKCLLTNNSQTQQAESTCYCVCDDCKDKYEEVVQSHKDNLDKKQPQIA